MWNEISMLEGKTLRTLDQNKQFDIVAVTEHMVIVQPHETQIERKIPRNQIEDSYNSLALSGQITRVEIHKKFSNFIPAYVAAILAKLPGIEHSSSPIRLWIKGKKELK